MTEEKKTGCECPLAGFCNRHGVTKTPHQHKLCQSHPGYFQQWEACQGPGQRFNDCVASKESTAIVPTEVPIETSLPQATPQAMPSLWQQAKNFGVAMANHAKSGFMHVSEETKQERLAICAKCPFLENGRCKKCGCWLESKTSLSTSHCPILKW